MGLNYYWRRKAKSWKFSLKGRHVTFGCWMHIAMDKVSEEAGIGMGGKEMKSRYLYRPLESPKDIRILELAPGEPLDPLQGTLVHNQSLPTPNDVSIMDWSIKYEAMSYAWGVDDSSKNEKSQIVLDGFSSLSISPNLDIALRHLRSPSVTRMLWVDAICINQDDVHERNTQVQQMMEIYARAELVNIWLGPAQRDSHMGMSILKYLAQSTLDEPAPWSSMPEEGFLSGLREVLSRDWFNRIWVVQEAAVSQKAIMMCGQDSFDWKNDPTDVRKFIRRIKYASISPQWEQAGLSALNLARFLQILNMQIQHIERQSPETVAPPPDILDIAFEMRHRDATDPRDKLFAIMGLVDRSLFQADYTMNVEMVFQQLLEAVEI